jgi:hypothetical protein
VLLINTNDTVFYTQAELFNNPDSLMKMKLIYDSVDNVKKQIFKSTIDAYLLPLVEISTSGVRFENEHFSLSKEKLRRVTNSKGEHYPDKLIELVNPEGKDYDEYKKRTASFYETLGIQYREISLESYVVMGIEVITNLKTKIQKQNILDMRSDNTGLMMSSANIVMPQGAVPLKTDKERQSEILNNIAREQNIQPLRVVNETCSGFCALIEAAENDLNKNQNIDHIIVLTNEKMSETVDYTNCTTSVLFGDLSTAMVVTRKKVNGFKILGSFSKYYRAYIDNTIGLEEGDCGKVDATRFDDGVSTNGKPMFRMDGRVTYKQAIKEMPNAVKELADALKINKIKQIWCHQSNQIILIKASERVRQNFPEAVVPIYMEAGNTSSSTIPRLIHAIINTPEKVLIPEIDPINTITKSLTSISSTWKAKDIVATTSIGAGLYIRGTLLQYEN